MTMTRRNETIDYRSQRWSIAGPPARFVGSYRGIGSVAEPGPDTLDHFLTERYCLYSARAKRIWRADILHPRWSLQVAEATIEHNSMIAAAGVTVSESAPLLHFSAFQDVRVWRPVRVR